MIEVEYDCQEDISHLSPEGRAKLDAELDRDNWFRTGYHIDGTTLTISGSCEVDDYVYAAPDVAHELNCLLWKFNIDADVEAHEVKHEPDWDKMPGGVDYH